MAVTLASDSDHCDSLASRFNIRGGAEMKLTKIQMIGKSKAQRKPPDSGYSVIRGRRLENPPFEGFLSSDPADLAPGRGQEGIVNC
jgi:hypothetical protein